MGSDLCVVFSLKKLLSAHAINTMYMYTYVSQFVLSMSALPMLCLFLLTVQSQTVGTRQRIATPLLV